MSIDGKIIAMALELKALQTKIAHTPEEHEERLRQASGLSAHLVHAILTNAHKTQQPVDMSEDAKALRNMHRELEIIESFEAEYADILVDLTEASRIAQNHDMRYANPETQERYWGYRDGYNAAMEKVLSPTREYVDERAVPKGWRYYSSDFSRYGCPGRVTITRDEEGKKWWLSLTEEQQEEEALYWSGFGKTWADALFDAINHIEDQEGK